MSTKRPNPEYIDLNNVPPENISPTGGSPKQVYVKTGESVNLRGNKIGVSKVVRLENGLVVATSYSIPTDR